MLSEIDYVRKTQETMGALIKKPVLTEKLLMKPPFRFLHDLVTSVMQNTPNGQALFLGIFDPNDLDWQLVNDREKKVVFLQKLIDRLARVTGRKLTAKPSKIVAGQEPEKTNEMLQLLAKAAKNFKQQQNESRRGSAADAAVTNGTLKTSGGEPLEGAATTTLSAGSDKENKAGMVRNPEPGSSSKTEGTKPKRRDSSRDGSEKKLSTGKDGPKTTPNVPGAKKTNERPKKIENGAKLPKTTETLKKNTDNGKKIAEKFKSTPKKGEETESTVEKSPSEIPLNRLKSRRISVDKEISKKSQKSDQITEKKIERKKSTENVDTIEKPKRKHSTHKSNVEVEKTNGKLPGNGEKMTENGQVLLTGDEALMERGSSVKRREVQSAVDIEEKQQPLNKPDIEDFSRPGSVVRKAISARPPSAASRTQARPPTAKRIEYSDTRPTLNRKELPNYEPPPTVPPSSGQQEPPPPSNDVIVILPPEVSSKFDDVDLLKSDKKNGKKSDDDDDFIIEADQTLDFSAPGREEGASSSGEPAVTDAELQLGQHGQLVRKMLEVKKELAPTASTQGPALVKVFDPNERQKTKVQCENAQKLIQQATRDALSLGKLAEFLREDAGAMLKELRQWRDEYKNNSAEIRRQMGENNTQKVQLNQKLRELDLRVKEELGAIGAAKGQLWKRAEKMEKMINLMVSKR